MPNNPPIPKGLVLPTILLTVLLAFACGSGEPDYSDVDARSFHEWLDAEESTPAQLIAAAADSGLAVFLAQDDPMRTDTVELAEALLPALYDAGLREWGVYFLDEALQEKVDSLVLPGNALDDGEAKEEAERLLFAADASMGYADYRDFLLYARSFNAGLETGEAPFRIRALSRNGVPDETIVFPENTADGTEENAEAAEADEGGSPPPKEAFQWLIWILAEDLPKFTGGEGRNETYVAAHALPRKGIIAHESARRDIRDRTFAFETESPPFGGWNPTPWEASADLIIATPFPLKTAEPIPGFVDEESSAEAAADFPELRLNPPSSQAAAKMNRFIRRRPAVYQRSVDRSLR